MMMMMMMMIKMFRVIGGSAKTYGKVVSVLN